MGIATRRVAWGKGWRKLASLLLLCGCTLLAAAAPAPVKLRSGEDARQIEAAMRFAPNNGQTFEQLAQAYRQGRLGPDFASADDRAKPYQPIWGIAELVAPADAGGSWIALSRSYGTLNANVWLLRQSGKAEPLLTYDYLRPYEPGYFAIDQLKTQPILLAPGERAMLIVRIVHGPVRSAAFDLLTPQSLADHVQTKGMILAAFYVFAFALLLFFLAAHLSFGNRLGAAYGLLFVFGLASLAYQDFLFFRFLYPNRPQWHLPVGFLLLNAMILTGLLIARAGMRIEPAKAWRENRWIRRIGDWSWLLPGVAICLLPFLIPEASALLAYTGFFLMAGLQVWLMNQFAQDNRNLHLAKWVFALVIAALLALLAWQSFGPAGSGFAVTTWLKLIYTLAASLTLTLITMDLVTFHRQHKQALHDRLTALEREKAQGERLIETERDYYRARDQAAMRQRQLATASHDIRQPLASLRMTFDAMAAKLDESARANLGEALDYLDSLSTSYLADARPDDADNEAPVDESARSEPYPLSVALGAVRQMFADEAAAKGLQFKVVESTLQTDVAPMAVMRIVSNLVSNAVKYTDSGRVLAGVRRGGAEKGKVRLLVVDTGLGMTADEIATFQQAWSKGAQSGGQGLGLAICRQLAENNGLELEVSSTPGRGSAFCLVLPVLH